MHIETDMEKDHEEEEEIKEENPIINTEMVSKETRLFDF